MTDLLASGRVVDAILGLMVLEIVILARYHRRTGRGVAPRALLCNGLAGGFLLLALRGALANDAWRWIALCLFAALVAHLADLWQRWRA